MIFAVVFFCYIEAWLAFNESYRGFEIYSALFLYRKINGKMFEFFNPRLRNEIILIRLIFSHLLFLEFRNLSTSQKCVNLFHLLLMKRRFGIIKQILFIPIWRWGCAVLCQWPWPKLLYDRCSWEKANDHPTEKRHKNAK